MVNNFTKRICIIGNNASGASVSDGGRIKIRLYHELLLRNGFESHIIDLDKWHKHLFSTLHKIKKSSKVLRNYFNYGRAKRKQKNNSDRQFFNNKRKARTVFCPLGIGTLEKIVSHLNENEVIDFLNNVNYYGIKDKKMEKQLKLLDSILPQNEVLSDCYKQFYNLDNVFVLNNFRDVIPIKKKYKVDGNLTIVYVSRVLSIKTFFPFPFLAKKKGVFHENSRSNKLFIL